MANTPKTPDPADRPDPHQEDLLDEALEESFPASDPPSVARHPPKDEE